MFNELMGKSKKSRRKHNKGSKKERKRTEERN
jgi:hypothetical protein